MKLYMLVGNIATGKTTTAKLLCKNDDTVCVSMDSLRYMLKAGDYVFDPRYENALRVIEDQIINEFMWHNLNIVVDDAKLVCPLQRAELLNQAHEKDYEVICVRMPETSKETCVNRRVKEPHGNYSKEHWGMVWEMFNKAYVKPTKLEGFDAILKAEDIRSGFLG
jgi:predicted kinase